jgi:hypothetical protein
MNEVSTSMITEKHNGLKEQFVTRVKHLLEEPQIINQYSVSNRYGMEVEETELEVNGFKIAIRVTK